MEVLASFDKTMSESRDRIKKNERSELLLFKARILEDSGDIQGAIKVLVDNSKEIVDNGNRLEYLSRNYMKSGENEKAIDCLE